MFAPGRTVVAGLVDGGREAVVGEEDLFVAAAGMNGEVLAGSFVFGGDEFADGGCFGEELLDVVAVPLLVPFGIGKDGLGLGDAGDVVGGDAEELDELIGAGDWEMAEELVAEDDIEDGLDAAGRGEVDGKVGDVFDFGLVLTGAGAAPGGVGPVDGVVVGVVEDAEAGMAAGPGTTGLAIHGVGGAAGGGIVTP